MAKLLLQAADVSLNSKRKPAPKLIVPKHGGDDVTYEGFVVADGISVECGKKKLSGLLLDLLAAYYAWGLNFLPTNPTSSSVCSFYKCIFWVMSAAEHVPDVHTLGLRRNTSSCLCSGTCSAADITRLSQS